MRTAVLMFLLTFFYIPASHAATLQFGSKEEFRHIQDTRIKDGFQTAYLARKITTEWFILPYSIRDGGYVLANRAHRFVPLDGAKIRAYQAQGLLPNPLPPFSLSLWDYALGYSLWIFVILFSIEVSRLQRRRIRNWWLKQTGKWRLVQDMDVAEFLRKLERLNRIQPVCDLAELAKVKERTGASDRKLWLLNLDGILVSIWSDRDPYTLNYGVSSAEEMEPHRTMMKEWWGITTREELIELLERLSDGMHSHEYDALLRIWSDERNSLKEEMSGDAHTRKNMQIVGGTLPYVRGRSLAAWDFGRGIMLAKNGYLLGFLTESEAWNYIERFGAEIGRRYESWTDYGSNYIIGRVFWEQDKTEYTLEMKTVRRLLTAKGGAWRVAPWCGRAAGSTRQAGPCAV